MVIYYIPDTGTAHAVVYGCDDAFPHNKYMATIHETGQETRYTCIQFLLRSRNAVQLKMASPQNVQSPALCADVYMTLLNAPLVYFSSYGNWALERLPLNSYSPCPLDGGYILREWFDEQGHAAFEADRLMPPVKLENECEKGEGIQFVCDKNKAKCRLPHPSLHKKNNFCLADWMDDKYTYMIVYNADDDHVIPCIRYPTKHGDGFTLHIFLDGVCDATETVTQSRSYRRLSLLRHPESYCGDRTQSCETIDRSRCASGLADHCRHTCNVCAQSNVMWSSLRTDPQFRGSWVKDTYNQGYENILIDSEYMSIPSLGRYRLYEKHWYKPDQEDLEREPVTSYATWVPKKLRKEYLMVQTFQNGCSPRVSLLNIAKRSDTVLSLRISQPAVIQHFGQTQQALEEMDKSVSLKRKPRGNVYEMYRNWPGNWFNIARLDETPRTVACQFDYDSFRITMRDGRICEGSITRLTSYKLEMSFRSCNTSLSSNMDTPAPTTFECLAVYIGEFGKRYMITRIMGGLHNLVNHRHICWAFSAKRYNTIQWMRVSDCDVSTEDYVTRRVRFSLATVLVDNMSANEKHSWYNKWLICMLILFRILFG